MSLMKRKLGTSTAWAGATSRSQPRTNDKEASSPCAHEFSRRYSASAHNQGPWQVHISFQRGGGFKNQVRVHAEGPAHATMTADRVFLIAAFILPVRLSIYPQKHTRKTCRRQDQRPQESRDSDSGDKSTISDLEVTFMTGLTAAKQTDW